MKPVSRKTALIGVGLLSVIAMAVVALRPARSSLWTDGGAIRVQAEGAPIREVLWLPAAPLPRTGSASSDEYEPRCSADGTLMVFVRNRPGQNADLFTARWTPGGWGAPEPLTPVNTENDELGPELSRDGNSLYFYSDRPGGLGGYDLWVSRRDADTWGEPINLGPSINSRHNEYGPALTPDGDRLYFSSNRPRPGEPDVSDEVWKATVREHRTRRDYDLYTASLAGANGPAAPVSRLNTPADEGAPALSPSGDFLYFASDRAPGHGGFDLYRARITYTGALSTPENLGSSINSNANDLDPALSSDGFRLTFSSDRPLPGDVAATRYTLWGSASREVYRETDTQDSRVLAALQRLWPWLLLLLLTLIPLILLARLARDARWRSRFATMSLLAQCLLLSVVVHAAIASGLTVWKVGSGVIDLVRSSGDGTRVILSSGTPAGSIESQVRGEITSGTHVVMPPEVQSPSLVVLAALDAPLLEPPLPSIQSNQLAAPVSVSQPTRETATLPDRPQSPVASAATHDTPIPVNSPTQGPTTEPSLNPSTTTVHAAAPTVHVPIGTTPIDVPLSALAQTPTMAPTVAAPTPAEVPHAEGPQRTSTSVRAQQPLAESASLPAPATPAPRGGRVISEHSPQVATTPPPGPSLSGLSPGASAPIIIEPPALAGTGATAPLSAPVPAQGSVEHSSGTTAPRASRLAGPIAAAPDATAAVPVPAPGSRTAAREAAVRPLGVDASISVPVAPGGLSSAGSTGYIQVDPGRLEPAASGAPLSTPGLAERTGPRSETVPPLSMTAPKALGGGLAMDIPIPRETFEQRAPGSREELVAKMGGSRETERAVGLALEWFKRHQSAHGFWSARGFDDGCGACSGAAEIRSDTAMTGLVLLCYLGAGHTHQADGAYKDTVAKAVHWLVARQAADGDLRRGETMYGQTVGAVALCEAFAMTRDPALAGPARRAVEFVLAQANKSGRADDRDTSVLGWLVFTVESARRAGFTVPQTTFDSARTWLKHVEVSGAPGRYSYAPGGQPSAAMTAEAMFVQQLLGRTRVERPMQSSAAFILQTPPKWGEGAPTYYWYYATLALFQHQGETWRQWNDRLVAELLAHQRKDGAAAGSWDTTDEWSRMGGRLYQTAVCTLSLEVYYRYKAE